MMELFGAEEKKKNPLFNGIEKDLLERKKSMDLPDFVEYINEMRELIHNLSPFKSEPTDFVKWIPNESVHANDYNPNKVAPPEMQLLEVSIDNDGYTQPIVTWPHDDMVEVIDGFHRHRVGKESSIIRKRVQGFLPTVIIRKENEGKNERMASTIRHNRARGKHTVNAMSEIVLELKNRNWKNARIAKQLGMDEEEILRLCQISGLEDIFKDTDFSRSWNIEDSEDDFTGITDEVTEMEKEQFLFRTANTSDPGRIFHTFDKWECAAAGFYDTNKEGMTKAECETEYATLLTNDKAFREALDNVISEWKHSCEHYLTNKAMNRIAWLGQASLCYAKKIPSTYRGGWALLSEKQQDKANRTAHEYLNKWMVANNREEVPFEEALSVGRQVEIY